MVVTLLFMPFTKVLARLAEWTIPDREEEHAASDVPVLDERLFNSPAWPSSRRRAPSRRWARNAGENYAASIPLLFRYDGETVVTVNHREDVIDTLEATISQYLIKLTDKELTENESQTINELINFVVDFERVGDYAINIVERAGEIHDKELEFTDTARSELEVLDGAVREIISLAVRAFTDNDMRVAERVEPLEETIDELVETLRDNHIRRLKDGVCALDTGIIYLELLTHIERISDHCSNVAARIIGRETDGARVDTHEFRRRAHGGDVPRFNTLAAGYRDQYLGALEQVEQS